MDCIPSNVYDQRPWGAAGGELDTLWGLDKERCPDRLPVGMTFTGWEPNAGFYSRQDYSEGDA